jgi:endonuclease/exonuclease/phosphatase family metal-dependent hydrolase
MALGQAQAILDNAHGAFISMDQEGRIVYWNASAEGVFGFTSAEAVGQMVAETIIPERYRDAHRRGLPWTERVLAVRLHEGAELVNVHSPTSAKPDLVKVRTHEAIYRHLTTRATAGRAQILCGDLNTPRKELADGGAWTFARDRYGRLRADRGERWERAELSLIRGLEPYGFHDALLCKRDELSWEWPRWGGGYRLDHLLLRECTGVGESYYEHLWRHEGLSDHSALVAHLEI